MQKQTLGRSLKLLVLASMLSMVACSDDSTEHKPVRVTAQVLPEPVDVIARVADQRITFTELSSIINSSAMIDAPLPTAGTPERKQLLTRLLDKAIGANLIYLDARRKGVHRLTSYTEDVTHFENALIASLYKSGVMIGDVHASESEVLHFYNTRTSQKGELTDDVRLVIESMIRQQKLDALNATLRQRLRENVVVEVNDKILSVNYDALRSEADVVATYNRHRVTWSQVRADMLDTERASQANDYIEDDLERRKRLEAYIDNAIMAMKGREAGLDKDPGYFQRAGEYRKTRLINEHRNGLIHSWNPTEGELKSYFVNNLEKIVIPERRKIQMVVVATKEEAQSIKHKIDNNEISMDQAAYQYSIDPDARRTLGEVGWVTQGTGFEGLDAFTFNLELESVSEPVESPAGWHLVKVLDVSAARYGNLDDPGTRQRTFRAFMQDRFNEYIDDLRKNHFNVVVDEDALDAYFQKEADNFVELGHKARQQDAIAGQPVDDMPEQVTPTR